MASWQLELSQKAEDDLRVLDHLVRRRIVEALEWLGVHFDETIPIPLGGSWKGFFKLRVGDWRIIYEVNIRKKLLVVYYIDRRDKIYKRRK